MKTILGLILAATIAAPAFAQPALPGQPADTGAVSTVTNKPAAKKTAKQKTAKAPKPAATAEKKKPAELATETPLVDGGLASPKQNYVVVRGQPKIDSEIVTHLQMTDTVSVITVETLKHPKQDEPARWAKIVMPSSGHVWVNTSFIDNSNQVVKARKLNMRTGPGENYSVAGLLMKGDAVKTLQAKGEWTEIETPTNAYAFVAAHLLKAKEATPAIPVAPPAPVTPTIVSATPTPTTPVTSQSIVTASGGATTPVVETPTPVVPAQPVTPPVTPTPTPQPAVTLPQPVAAPPEEPPGPRIVDREGIVRGTASIQSPGYYKLEAVDSHATIDFLYSTTTNIDLGRWRGVKVLVTGQEGLDERWPNTPVLVVQHIGSAQ